MAFNFGGSTTAPKPTLNFGNTSTNTNTATPSLFAGIGPKQTQPATTAATQAAPTQNNPGSSLFMGLGNKPAQSTNPFGQSATAAIPSATANTANSNLGASTLNASTLASSGAPQIDIAHLRSTTKYDHLTPQLQQEILALDTAILNQIRQCTDVSDLLPSVVTAGGQLAPAIDFVGSKLDELETGLENDAEAVVALRDGDISKDEGEAKCVFRTVDRLKVPRQYQVGNTDVTPIAGGFNGGMSGWWNQPQTYKSSSIRNAGTSVQLVEEDLDDDKSKGPKNLVDLFSSRTREMNETSTQQRQLLGEIEQFVAGLEQKVYNKERELNERLDNGTQMDGDAGFLQEREHQMQLLRYVFGEVQKNLYEVAERVGTTRDGVVDLGFRR